MWTQISNRLSSLDEDDDYEQDFVEFSDSTNHFHHHHHDGHSQLTSTANHSSRDNDNDDDPSYSEFKPSSSSSSAKNIHPSTYKLLRDLSNVSKQQNDNMNDMHEIDTLGHGENDFETWVWMYLFFVLEYVPLIWSSGTTYITYCMKVRLTTTRMKVKRISFLSTFKILCISFMQYFFVVL